MTDTMAIAPQLARARKIAGHLAEARPVSGWRAARGRCPGCGPSAFVAMRAEPLWTRCLRCRNTAINLALIPAIDAHLAARPAARAWEMSTYGATLDHLRRVVPEVVDSEYFEGRAPGETVDGIRNEDAQATSFDDESLDLVTSNQVYEHVPDDIAAYREAHRILRPGGSLIFTVPFYPELSATEQRAEIRDGAVHHLLPPVYHDSRIAGPGTILTFWHHSRDDIADRVAAAGFAVELRDITVTAIQGAPVPVVCATKAG